MNVERVKCYVIAVPYQWVTFIWLILIIKLIVWLSVYPSTIPDLWHDNLYGLPSYVAFKIICIILILMCKHCHEYNRN